MSDNTKKTNIKKTIRNLVVFIVLIGFTFYYILKDQDPRQIWDVILSCKIEYVILGIIAMGFYFACEAFNIKRILSTFNENITFKKAYKFTLIGFFFSSITPAASGGQPMEIYFMHKEKISVANSTLALLIQLCCFQIVTIFCGVTSAIIHANLLHDDLTWLFIIGIGLNSSALALLLVSIFSKRLSKKIVDFSIWFLRVIKYKKVEEKKKSFEEALNKYHNSSKFIKEHKDIFFKSILVVAVELMIFYSIPFFAYKALGLSGHGWFTIATLQALLYATVSGIPSPGAVGVSEGVFLNIFGPVFSESLLASGMLINRGMSFYSYVIISAIVTFVNSIVHKDIVENNIEEKNKE